MKNNLLLFFGFFLIYCFSLNGQSLVFSTQELNFPTLNEKQKDSLLLTITHSGTSSTFNVKINIPFKVFGSNPFGVKDSSFLIGPGQSKSIFVYCKITQNTPNPSNLIVAAESFGQVEEYFVRLKCQGRFSKLYYSGTQNLSEEALKQSLKTKLNSNVNSLSYNVARDKMYGFIDNQNDTVTCVYTNRKAKFNTRAGATSNNFNCEHTFPQGFFGSAAPMVSDIHHLFSTDDAANNSRGNLPFGMAVAPFILPAVNAPSKNGGGKYEPQDSHKGAAARSMMYFVLRYQDYSNFYAPQDQIFRIWNAQFPPSNKDTLRNAAIFVEQNNRNPFVDYPQFSNRIKNLVGLSVSDSVQKLGRTNSVFYNTEKGSMVIWNEGNKSMGIRNIRFSQNIFSFLNGTNQNGNLGYNEARQFLFERNPATIAVDTLIFESDDPLNPINKIPFNIGTIQVGENIFENKPTISPNPASDFIQINGLIKDSQVAQIEVYSADGKLKKQGKNFRFERPSQFPVSDLSPGIYFVKIVQKSRIDNFKFIKQ